MNTVLIQADCPEVPPALLRSSRRFVRKALQLLGINDWEVSILLCDNERMRELNKRYRGKDAPTDVLSFSQCDGSVRPPSSTRKSAGDIVVSLDMMRMNAQKYGSSQNEELKRLYIHGLLHLMGKDHQSDFLSDPMLIQQERLMQELKEERLF